MSHKVAVDIMGGDNLPEALLPGVFEAIRAYKIPIQLVASKTLIQSLTSEKIFADKQLTKYLEWADADDVITMEDHPTFSFKKKALRPLSKRFSWLKRARLVAPFPQVTQVQLLQ